MSKSFLAVYRLDFVMMGSVLAKKSTFLWSVYVLFFCVYRNVNAIEGGAFAVAESSSKHAYATMMYMGTPRDYEFYIAIRVMIRSLVKLKTNADLVVIASKDVPLDWGKTLCEDGARVVYVDNIDNPYKNQSDFDRRFALSLNKLYAWSLVDYERVVMLDADNVFLQKTDELFLCGQFCAVFINPCILHTGLFVLQPSEKVFKHMLHQLATGLKNEDGADQGFVAAHFDDLLERPMFHPPTNGSKLNGFYRLPIGYQMDASFYYLALKWDIPCGPNSVITFPSALWLKPWYWWAWPVLPLGLSWHTQRLETIGYDEEIPLAVAQSVFYIITAIIAISIRQIFNTKPSSPNLCCLKSALGFSFYSVLLKKLIPFCIAASYLIPFFFVPKTIHPLMGWGLYLLGSMSLLIVIMNTFCIPVLAVITIWIQVLGALLVMAFPLYSNGMVRALSVGVYGFLAAPFLWRSGVKVMRHLDTCFEDDSLFSRFDHKQSRLSKLS
ncbi:hypothetical protein SUGI_1160330 [Cryptomeria japonica]|uniref:putative glucuronosyltransferase PGSIP8 n=1 Tax=Cryptomeria japonica TaxID=3369 RepID=UPI00241471F1|nr:putative glucuronosyltransferase PGSIP8 [Cryptomeria japonica]GLJ54153.1 hypothetical protein SUGI_1160330 [Cryptomeria japonica]